MKLYRKKFFVIIAFGFVTIFGWSIITSYISHSSAHTNSSTKILTDSYLTTLTEEPLRNEIIVSRKAASKYSNSAAAVSAERSTQMGGKVRNIVCNINGEYKVNCVKLVSTKGATVYVPFSLIHKYFEINGKIVTSKNQEYFEWSHSYSRIFYPDEPYNPTGKFLWFANYNVEIRERVKCVSAIEHVPISTQWYAKGHFYPTQIAQYGLSHFSKNLSEPAPARIVLIQDGSLATNITSQPPLPSHSDGGGDFLSISDNATVYLSNDFNQPNYLNVDIDFRIRSNATISFYITDADGNKEPLCLQYNTVDAPLHRGTHNHKVVAVYGLGRKVINSDWQLISRDLLVDLFKGNLITNRKRGSYRIVRIEFTGQMNIRNLLLLSSAHDRFARAAGDWLVRHQNKLGGWDIKVKRRLQKSTGGALLLNEGWHSAMAQGQAISLLTRLYSVTEQTRYLEAAKKALAVFEVESFKNGVKALLFDKFVWYEEYPTVPSIFVLNGFIYSLFGLYDLSKTCHDPACQKSGQLFEEGIRSLEAVLPMYDSGSGSFYDLRHHSLASAPNVARWDYHSTHINQLLFLYTIVRRDTFQSTADRWIAYMKGHRAPHN